MAQYHWVKEGSRNVGYIVPKGDPRACEKCGGHGEHCTHPECYSACEACDGTGKKKKNKGN